jgi:outer membrane protein assembly complex protein YaeT
MRFEFAPLTRMQPVQTIQIRPLVEIFRTIINSFREHSIFISASMKILVGGDANCNEGTRIGIQQGMAWYARWHWLVCLGAFLIGISGLKGQTPSFEGKRIVSIEYDPSPAPLAAQDLARKQTLKAGTPLRMTDVADAIDGLYSTGHFEDIQVDAKPSGPDGVIIRFITKNTWFVGHVGVSGKTSSPPNRGQIVNVTQLSLGQPFNDAQLTTAVASVKKLLEQNGLYEASVEQQTKRNSSSQSIDFTFIVRAGKRARYSMPGIQGDPKLSDATILRATGWRVPLIHWWRQVTQAKTQGGLTGIEKRYQKQERLTATVRLDDLKYDPKKRRVSPQLTLNAGPKVRIKAIEAKIPKRKLRKYVPVYDEGTVDRDLLVEGARNLRDYFQSQGYYDVSVDFRELPVKNDELTIEYVIALGTRYKLVKVDIQGNKYFENEDLRERMFLQPAGLLIDRHGRYSEAFRRKDEEAIANLYRANGFRDVKVTSTVQSPFKGIASDIGVTFTVDEGKQWFIDKLTIEGLNTIKTSTLAGSLASADGQPFSDVNVAADRNTILTALYSRGFPAAAFEYKTEPSAAPQHVNITYVVTEGKHELVRDVLTTGIRTTRQRLIDRTIDLEPGDDLALPHLTEVQRKLYNLGIFAKVDTAVQNPDGDTAYKFVLYDFEEAARYNVNVGVGAEIAQFGGTTTNLTSPGGATGFSPRGSLNISRLNMFGIGHTVSFRSQVSDLEQRASIDYLAPRFMNNEGRNITYTLLYDNARDVRTFASRREEASVQVSQKLSKPSTLFVRFAYRRVSTSDVVIPTLLVPQLLQPVRIGILSGSFVQDRRDDPTDAHRGIFNTVDAGLAAKFFGSQRNFARILGRNATYTRIRRNLVLARQTQFGMILPYNAPSGISDQNSVPLPERFFGGGASTHRGFPYNQAGPRDIGEPAGAGAPATQPTGFPLGGNALFFNNTELRFPLIGANIGGVIFHDAGNVYSGISTLSLRSHQKNLQDFNYMVHAVGFGIRYRTPVGPVRVDLAYSINPPHYLGFASNNIRDLLSCNPNLPPSQLPPACQTTLQSVGHFQFSFSIGQAF